MSYYEKPIILMFLGVPGSGKSYFARNVSQKLGAIRLNSDSMRMSIFGSRKAIDNLYESKDRVILNSYVFNALDYATEQILSNGNDLVYDAHSNRRSDRRTLEKLAAKTGAIPVLVWVNTSEKIAIKRVQHRDESEDQRKLSEDKALEVVSRHRDNMDLPDGQEKVIKIDGQVDFEEQFKQFSKQIVELIK